jgi:hypothetical protein
MKSSSLCSCPSNWDKAELCLSGMDEVEAVVPKSSLSNISEVNV